RPALTVIHDRNRSKARAVDLPRHDDGCSFAALAFRPCFPARADWPLLADAALTGEKMPAVTGTWTGIILECDERAAVERDDVEPLIIFLLVEQPARFDAAAVATSERNALPVIAAGDLRGIAQRLEAAAVVDDEFTAIGDLVLPPNLR